MAGKFAQLDDDPIRTILSVIMMISADPYCFITGISTTMGMDHSYWFCLHDGYAYLNTVVYIPSTIPYFHSIHGSGISIKLNHKQ